MQCLVCGDILSNKSTVQTELKRSLEKKHVSVSYKAPRYFHRLKSSDSEILGRMVKRRTMFEKSLIASYIFKEKRKQNNCTLSKKNWCYQFVHKLWCAELTYLAHTIFSWNSIPGIPACMVKKKIWSRQVTKWQRSRGYARRSSSENGDLSSFPVSEDVAGPLQPKENHPFQKLVVKNFSAIQTALENYFPSILISGVEWVRSPYGACSEHSVYSVASLTSVERDQLIDITADTT
jgi:hypothetical protein